MSTPPINGENRDSESHAAILGHARTSLANLQRAVEDTSAVIRDLERLTTAQSIQAPQPARIQMPRSVRAPQVTHPALPTRPERPARPALTSEQIIMRIIAVLGSLITVIGVGLGITLAIQSGLLGPLGRVILSVILASALAVVGFAIERKRGSNTGSTALYITSLTVFALVIVALVTWLEWWTWQAGAVAEFVLFTAFVAFGRWRGNAAVMVAAAVVAFVLSPIFFRNGTHVDALLYLSPLVLLFFTVPLRSASRMQREGTLRIVASLLAIFLYGVIGQFGPDAPAPVFFIAIGFALIAVAVEVTFPPPPLAARAPLPGPAVEQGPALPQIRWTHRAQLTVFPLLLLATALIHADGIYLWAFPLASALAFYLVEHLYRFTPGFGTRRGEAVTWLAFCALSFAMIYDGFGTGPDADVRRFITLAVFLAMFFGIILLLEQRPQYREVTWIAWTAAALYLTRDVSTAVLSLREVALVNGAVQLQAVCLALLLGFALWRHAALKGMHPAVLAGAGIVGMYLYMVAIVSFTTFVFYLFGAAESGVIIGHMLVSITWIVLAAWILLRVTRWPDKVTLRVGFVLAIAASIKLVFYDLSSLSGIPQVLAFVASGVMLIIIAALRGRTNTHSTQRDEQAPTAPNAPQDRSAL